MMLENQQHRVYKLPLQDKLNSRCTVTNDGSLTHIEQKVNKLCLGRKIELFY